MSLRFYRKYILSIGVILIILFFISSETNFNKNLNSEDSSEKFLVRDVANRYIKAAQYNALTVPNDDANLYRKNFIKKVCFFKIYITYRDQNSFIFEDFCNLF